MPPSYLDALMGAAQPVGISVDQKPEGGRCDLNFEPSRLTFISCKVCYVCDAVGPVQHEYYYHKAWNLYGWIFCGKCKSPMESVGIPSIYERNGDLPADCFRDYSEAPFFFDRISVSNPDKNGLTACTFLSEGPILYMREGEIMVSVQWDESCLGTVQKCVPLRTILPVSVYRWPTPQTFLEEFHIDVSEPMITQGLYQQWYLALCDAFRP